MIKVIRKVFMILSPDKAKTRKHNVIHDAKVAEIYRILWWQHSLQGGPDKSDHQSYSKSINIQIIFKSEKKCCKSYPKINNKGQTNIWRIDYRDALL